MLGIEAEYDPGRAVDDDPVVAMRGIGKSLWQAEAGDQFVERLRSEEAPAVPVGNSSVGASDELSAAVWHRIERRQGEEFRTARGLPLTFKVDGNGLWFFRNGRRIERKLTRRQLSEAVSRCPLRKTTDIKDLMDYAYVFALLQDPRIRAGAW